jgi:hypothetical protein
VVVKFKIVYQIQLKTEPRRTEGLSPTFRHAIYIAHTSPHVKRMDREGLSDRRDSRQTDY